MALPYDTEALPDQPAWRAVGVDTLIHQARLPHASLAHERHDLSVPRSGTHERLLESRELCLPPDEARQAARYRRLEAPADRTRADDFIDLHRLGQAFDRHGPEGIDVD